jgi:alpha-beta hydrolase superfamily lysophospholipase
MIRAIVKHGILFILYGAICSVTLVIVLYVNHLQNRPDLRPWHQAELNSEFRVSKKADIKNLADYQKLEARVFKQLQEQVYDKIDSSEFRLLNRYNKGSLSDPLSYPQNWNRTFEMPVANPRGGVVLVHGLTDSPYSLRSLAQTLHAMNFWVVGLRLPGHGTAPSGLLHVTWQDFSAATELAARYVKNQIGEDQPFYIAGFSTGAALAVEYSLSILAGKDNPMPDGLVLLSPAIGVSPLAALAVWQARLSTLPGMEKAAWDSILPEFDPYKYKSFAVNAGDQIYQLTLAINKLVRQLDTGKGISGLPKILAFQSVVDATVSTPALVSSFYNHLADEGHELVLFDINRYAEVEPVLISNPEATTAALLKNKTLSFTLTFLTNISKDSRNLGVKQKPANSDIVTEKPLQLVWPRGVFSLSHSAIPFPPDDPVYGAEADPKRRGIHLGRINVLGEQGVLLFSADEVIRLRYNPFYSYLEQRVKEFVTQQRSEGVR